MQQIRYLLCFPLHQQIFPSTYIFVKDEDWMKKMDYRRNDWNVMNSYRCTLEIRIDFKKHECKFLNVCLFVLSLVIDLRYISFVNFVYKPKTLNCSSVNKKRYNNRLAGIKRIFSTLELRYIDSIHDHFTLHLPCDFWEFYIL